MPTPAPSAASEEYSLADFVTKGYTNSTNRIIYASNISLAAFRIYFSLLGRAYLEEGIFPSYEQLRKDTGIGSCSTIKAALEDLTSLGLVSIEKGKQGRSNRYKILPPENARLVYHATFYRSSHQTKTIPSAKEATPVKRDIERIYNKRLIREAGIGSDATGNASPTKGDAA